MPTTKDDGFLFLTTAFGGWFAAAAARTVFYFFPARFAGFTSTCLTHSITPFSSCILSWIWICVLLARDFVDYIRLNRGRRWFIIEDYSKISTFFLAGVAEQGLPIESDDPDQLRVNEELFKHRVAKEEIIVYPEGINV